MTKTRSLFLFLLLFLCIHIVRAQDIVVADSTKSFVRNDTTFLDWRYLLMENESGRYDTCIQGHFVIPKGTPGLMDKILRNMAFNNLADWENPDTLFQGWKQYMGLDTLPHNELGDFPREWFAIVYNQGHFYLSDDYSYSQTFEDSLIRYYYMENWLGAFSDFRKTGEDEYAFNLYHKYADTPITIDSATIKPVPGVTGLYLLHYGSDYNRSNCELLTTREHLKDFDYVQSIIACYIDYLNRDAFPETKTPRLTVPDTGNIIENFGRITDYSVSITPAFAKIIRKSENVLPLYQGKASVKVNGLWGVVDVSGNWILPCIYATPPHYEWTGTHHKEGEPLSIITGDVPLIEGPYSDVRFLVDKHIALYNDSLWTIFDMLDLQAEDKPVFEDVYRANLHHFSYKENGKWGVKDYHYSTVIPAIYDTPPIAPLGNDSLFLVKQNDKKGVVDKDNKTIIPIIYQDLWPWSDRYFAAKQEHWGLINAHGETVIPLIFESIEHLDDTLMLVKSANGFGVLSLTGKYILPCQYSAIEPLGNQLYAVSDNRMKDAVVDSENHIVIPHQYDHIESFTNNRFLVRSNGKYGYLDPQGQEVIPLKYSWAKPFYNGYAWVRKNVVSWSIIDTKGRKLIPFSNHHHYIPTDEPFSGEGGTVCVERKGMYGIMDSTGKILVPFISHAPTCFINGIALIFDKDDHITAYADKESTYAFSEPYSYYARQEEFVLVERNNQYGILDLKKHQLVIPIIYDEIGEISPEGIAIALRNGRWGFVDIHGNTTFQ